MSKNYSENGYSLKKPSDNDKKGTIVVTVKIIVKHDNDDDSYNDYDIDNKNHGSQTTIMLMKMILIRSKEELG